MPRGFWKHYCPHQKIASCEIARLVGREEREGGRGRAVSCTTPSNPFQEVIMEETWNILLYPTTYILQWTSRTVMRNVDKRKGRI